MLNCKTVTFSIEIITRLHIITPTHYCMLLENKNPPVFSDILTYRAGLKGRGARENFYWRAPMTLSFVKVMLSLIRKVPVCFFR